MPVSVKRSLRLAIRFTLVLGGILLVLPTVGAIAELVLESREARAYPPPGRLIDVGGHRLHIHCVGPKEESPTVILDTGGTAFSAVWALIQPEIAETTRACVYDRAGLGWSETGPSPRSAEIAAQELHNLILHSGESGPYVLVGHSYGGIVIRKYFDIRPEGVAGLVFVDPSYPKQRSALTPEELEKAEKAVQRLHLMSLLGRFAILRLYPALRGDVLPTTGSELYDAIQSWPRHMRASALELERMDQSLEDPAFDSQDFEDRPVIVLSENTSTDRDRLRFKFKEHRRLANRSRRGIHIVVDGASHISFLTNPRHAHVVATTINEVLTAVHSSS